VTEAANENESALTVSEGHWREKSAVGGGREGVGPVGMVHA